MPTDFASFKPIVDLLNIQVPESNQRKEAGKLESWKVVIAIKEPTAYSRYPRRVD